MKGVVVATRGRLALHVDIHTVKQMNFNLFAWFVGLSTGCPAEFRGRGGEGNIFVFSFTMTSGQCLDRKWSSAGAAT